MTRAAGTQSNICWESLETAEERNLGTKKKDEVVEEVIHPSCELTSASVQSSLPPWWSEHADRSMKGSARTLIHADDLCEGENEMQPVHP